MEKTDKVVVFAIKAFSSEMLNGISKRKPCGKIIEEPFSI